MMPRKRGSKGRGTSATRRRKKSSEEKDRLTEELTSNYDSYSESDAEDTLDPIQDDLDEDWSDMSEEDLSEDISLSMSSSDLDSEEGVYVKCPSCGTVVEVSLESPECPVCGEDLTDMIYAIMRGELDEAPDFTEEEEF